MTDTVAAITAAGQSARLGRPKAMLTIGGCSFLERIAATVEAAGLARLVVVLGAESERLLAEVERLGAEPVVNPEWAAGRFTSVRVAAAAAEAGRLLLWPVDCPDVAPRTVVALAAAAEESPGRDLVPSFEGRGGHPVLLSPESVAEILSVEGDGNLRDVVARRRTDVAVDDPAVLDDVDTWEDYEALLARTREGHG